MVVAGENYGLFPKNEPFSARSVVATIPRPDLRVGGGSRSRFWPYLLFEAFRGRRPSFLGWLGALAGSSPTMTTCGSSASSLASMALTRSARLLMVLTTPLFWIRCSLSLWSSAAASNFSTRASSSVSQTSLSEQSHQGGLAVAVTVSNRDYFEKP